ncbi:MAG: PAS domain S-box protein [Nitrospinales bacterium]
MDKSQINIPKLPIGSLVLGRSLKIIQADDKFCEIFKSKPEDIVGRGIDDLFSPRDRKGARQFHEKLYMYQTGFQETVVALNICEKNFLCRIRFTKIKENWILYIEPLEREQDLFYQLYERQERWLNTLNYSSDGIAILDEKNNLIEFNQKFFDLAQFRSIHNTLLGYDAIRNKNIFDLIKEEKFAPIEQVLKKNMKGEMKPFQKVVFINNTYLFISFRPLSLPTLGIIGSSIHLNDITSNIKLAESEARIKMHAEELQQSNQELRMFAEELKKSEKVSTRFGRILEDAFVEIFIFNLDDLKFIQVNSGARENLGYEMDELRHLTAFDLNPDFTRKEFEVLIEPLRKKEKPVIIFETSFQRKNKTSYPVSIRLQLMYDESPPVVLAVVSDITERKLTENRLKKYSQELQRSNRELTDFASIAAHDLGDPLRKVISFGNRLKETNAKLDKRGLDYINRMQKSTIEMQSLINDLLTYSKVTITGKPFEKKSLSDIGEESLYNLETRRIKTKGKINIEKLPIVEVIPSLMRQLFQNLIGNALLYHREGIAPLINITGQSIGDENVKILFEDNGLGFEEKYLERVFQPFQRLHGRSAYEGTGMGLAICKKIVEHHHGTITAKSALGAGSTFVVTIPVKQTKY